MRCGLLVLAVIVFAGDLAYGELPKELDRSDQLFQFGLLDVTKAPTRPIRLARLTRRQRSSARLTTRAIMGWSVSFRRERS